MPKNFYPDNMIKRKKTQRAGVVLSSLLIVVAIGLSVMIALLMSNFITVGSFSFLNNGEFKKNGYKVYAISCYQSTVYSSACLYADSDQDKNGGGYVYFYDGIYHVLQSGYKEKSDADKVLEKLSQSGVNAQIVTIEAQTTTLGGSFSSAQQTALNNALMSFSNTFDTLYDISVALDTKVSGPNQVFSQLHSLSSSLGGIIDAFNNQFGSSKKDQLLQIGLSLEHVLGCVDDLLNVGAEVLLGKIRHCYFQIVDEHLSLNKVV